jgi:hypothetical protein
MVQLHAWGITSCNELLYEVKEYYMTKAKMFFNREHGFGGGYVIGDGKLPKGFDPDDFMLRFGQAIIMKCAPTDEELTEVYGEENLGVMRQISDAITAQTIGALRPTIMDTNAHDIKGIDDVLKLEVLG